MLRKILFLSYCRLPLSIVRHRTFSMSKRIATFQISDRNPVDPSDEEENYSNSSGSEREERASEQELRQRK